MSGITVIVVPTWAVWIFTALAAVNIAQHVWKIVLLKRQARREPPNVRGNAHLTAAQKVEDGQE